MNVLDKIQNNQLGLNPYDQYNSLLDDKLKIWQ